jgi:hypothetical protein
MITYMDRTWCKCENCKHYYECKKSQKYAMRKQAHEVKDVRDRIPYAVRDMSSVCEDFEVAE